MALGKTSHVKRPYDFEAIVEDVASAWNVCARKAKLGPPILPVPGDKIASAWNFHGNLHSPQGGFAGKKRTKLQGTVQKIIKPFSPNGPKKAQIEIRGLIFMSRLQGGRVARI